MDSQTQQDGNVRIVTDDVSCDNCTHRSVCSIYKGIEPMIAQQWAPDEQPLDPDDLAVICEEFTAESE